MAEDPSDDCKESKNFYDSKTDDLENRNAIVYIRSAVNPESYAQEGRLSGISANKEGPHSSPNEGYSICLLLSVL